MKAAAHHLWFLPRLQYIMKILASDVFFIGDCFQYTTHSEINRCAIKTPNGVQWLTVPVLSSGRRTQQILNAEIDNSRTWQTRIWRTLWTSYRRAPYFEKYDRALERLIMKRHVLLADLNMDTLAFVLRSLNAECKLVRMSELAGKPNTAELLLQHAVEAGCESYICEPESSRFVESAAARAGLRVKVLALQPPRYYQQFGAFAPGLSILDLLMNEGDGALQLLQQALVRR